MPNEKTPRATQVTSTSGAREGCRRVRVILSGWRIRGISGLGRVDLQEHPCGQDQGGHSWYTGCLEAVSSVLRLVDWSPDLCDENEFSCPHGQQSNREGGKETSHLTGESG